MPIVEAVEQSGVAKCLRQWDRLKETLGGSMTCTVTYLNMLKIAGPITTKTSQEMGRPL